MNSPRSRRLMARDLEVAPLETRTLMSTTKVTPPAGSVELLTPAQAYVSQVYENLLDRGASSADLDKYVPLVNQGKVGVDEVARTVVSSTEFRQVEIRSLYQSAFGSNISSQDMTNLLATGKGIPFLTFEADLLSSDLYYKGPGGGNNAAYLHALDSVLLGQDTGPGDSTYLGELDAGASRGTVVNQVLLSPQSAARIVDQSYGQTLLRAPDPTALGNATAAIEGGYSVEGLDQLLVTSLEYVKDAEGAVANTVVSLNGLGDFKFLTQLLGNSGMLSTLEGSDPYTLFAPTDAAFAALPTSTIVALLTDPVGTTKILEYHLVPGELSTIAGQQEGTVATLGGQTVRITQAAGGDIQINGVTLTETNIRTNNGIIHVIGGVLTPPAA